MVQMSERVTYQYDAYNEQQTRQLAVALAEQAYPGMVIALDGELGAGKTTFSQAFAQALGVKGIVNSPTFTIIKEYEGEIYSFYHMDVYRLSVEEADELGLDEYFFGDGVSLVEWASIIEDIFPSEYIALHIQYVTDGARSARSIELRPYGERNQRICSTLLENGVIT